MSASANQNIEQNRKRRNTVVAAVSTGKLNEVDSSEGRSEKSENSMTIDPLTSPFSSNNKENIKSTLTVTDPPRNHQLKKFSQSTPALPHHYDLINLGRSKSRQKKFLRHFPNVPRDERVLNRKFYFYLPKLLTSTVIGDLFVLVILTDYSCALVGDILLQGHLYVTYNYFAFHSNVFGYVRKVRLLSTILILPEFTIFKLLHYQQLLIPMADVRKITKEKTAKFFPNAIAISTATEKHLFSSLMSRDVAYRLGLSVWKKFHYPNHMEDCIDGIGVNLFIHFFFLFLVAYAVVCPQENEGSSQNGEHSSNESSRNSVDGLIINHTATSSIQVTSATVYNATFH